MIRNYSSVGSTSGGVAQDIRSLSFLSFNAGLLEYKVCGMKVYQNPPFTRRRLNHIPVALRSCDSDIVALQEVFDEAHADFLIENLRTIYPFVGRRTSGGCLALHNGLMVLSKFPIIHTKFHPFRQVTMIEKVFGSKGMLEVSVDIPGVGAVTLFNMHMASGAVDPESVTVEKVRAEEIEQLFEACDAAIYRGEIPIIIGDLNAAPELCATNYKSFIDQGWRDSWVLAVNDSPSTPSSGRSEELFPAFTSSALPAGSLEREQADAAVHGSYESQNVVYGRSSTAGLLGEAKSKGSSSTVTRSQSSVAAPDISQATGLDQNLQRQSSGRDDQAFVTSGARTTVNGRQPVASPEAPGPIELANGLSPDTYGKKRHRLGENHTEATEVAKGAADVRLRIGDDSDKSIRECKRRWENDASEREAVSGATATPPDNEASEIPSDDPENSLLLSDIEALSEVSESFVREDFTWDPQNPLNTIGLHSGCHGLRCDYVFLPPLPVAKELRNFYPERGDIVFREPRVMVDGCCFGCFGQVMLVTLSDHYALKIVLRKAGSELDKMRSHSSSGIFEDESEREKEKEKRKVKGDSEVNKNGAVTLHEFGSMPTVMSRDEHFEEILPGASPASVFTAKPG